MECASPLQTLRWFPEGQRMLGAPFSLWSCACLLPPPSSQKSPLPGGRGTAISLVRDFSVQVEATALPLWGPYVAAPACGPPWGAHLAGSLTSASRIERPGKDESLASCPSLLRFRFVRPALGPARWTREHHTEVRDSVTFGITPGPAPGGGQGQSSPSDARCGRHQRCQSCPATVPPGPGAGLGEERSGLDGCPRSHGGVAAERGVPAEEKQEPSPTLGM
ncbi:uncharacterized protein LOC129065674 [Pteronotus mesoamericanus]|uniref:uncharacterized protein LOC129065674 n=1 Tax=Pteronotus mesoamericanus TaxID=1884717 RepID=UPI0023EC069F|nr:uncharacterized protein LOC129065674 [Pteronotus parnellii mesoamericanus]